MGFADMPPAGEQKKNLDELTLDHATLIKKIEDLSSKLAKANEEIDDLVPEGAGPAVTWRDQETGMTVDDLVLERAKAEQELEDVKGKMKRESEKDDLLA